MVVAGVGEVEEGREIVLGMYLKLFVVGKNLL